MKGFVNVSYLWYGCNGNSDEINTLLAEHAFERAIHMLEQGFISGELYFECEKHGEYSGWWESAKNENFS